VLLTAGENESETDLTANAGHCHLYGYRLADPDRCADRNKGRSDPSK